VPDDCSNMDAILTLLASTYEGSNDGKAGGSPNFYQIIRMEISG